MSGYLDRLIGRVAHSRADTRPVIAPRFAPPPADMAQPAEPGTGSRPDQAGAPVPPQRSTQRREAAGHETRSERLSLRSLPQNAGNWTLAAQATQSSESLAAGSVREIRPAAEMRVSGISAERRGYASPVATHSEALLRSPSTSSTSDHPAPSADEPRTNATPFLLPPLGDARAHAPAAISHLPEPGVAPSAAERGEPEPPAVTVHIGRIEVRSEAPKPSARQKPARTPYRPRLRLDDYLVERREGKR